jgi:TrmH family RNA methyltransferase
MKNFELRDLRLVQPEEFDPVRIQGIAHQSGDLLKRVRMFDGLESALADCTHVAGMTARERTAKRNLQRPREAAPELLATARAGTAALVLGPEDRGLTNEELDRCHRSIVIPANPDHSSLNLAQAFTVMAYELYVARGTRHFKASRREAQPATAAQLEQLFASAEEALRAIEFFKTHTTASIMRTVREVVHRTPVDAREAKLFQAMCYEVVHYLDRRGVR